KQVGNFSDPSTFHRITPSTTGPPSMILGVDANVHQGIKVSTKRPSSESCSCQRQTLRPGTSPPANWRTTPGRRVQIGSDRTSCRQRWPEPRTTILETSPRMRATSAHRPKHSQQCGCTILNGYC